MIIIIAALTAVAFTQQAPFDAGYFRRGARQGGGDWVADQFSIHCIGTQRPFGASHSAPWNGTYSINLVNGTWCSGEGCTPAESMRVAANGRLVLRAELPPLDEPSAGRFEEIKYDVVTHGLVIRSLGTSGRGLTYAACETARFPLRTPQ